MLAFGLAAALARDVSNRVPLTIKAVQEGPSGLSPARNTIFALATLDKYIFHEVEPNTEGTIQVLVPPGRYILSALHGGKPLDIEVRAPNTFITVLVSNLGESVRVLPSPRSQQNSEKSANTKREDNGMTPSLWIGLCFIAIIVIFLMFTSFVHLNDQADKNLRFLTALCAGFAGGFFAGEALFRYQQKLGSGTNIFLSGTAGFALFFLVWLTYARKPHVTAPDPLPDETVKFSIPNGWTFEQAARAITNAAQRTIYFDGFDQAQLATKLSEIDIEAPTVREALGQLKYRSSALPTYQVTMDKGVYHLRRS
ncbi:MAG TPA: hypothetical protein VOA87_17850 [Thermoanaerobaculia bacterium]|nr:hypothetical protein [Thermoanaerobaculia bacterium]